jgi:endonuclease YncB( thermonuclease family)
MGALLLWAVIFPTLQAAAPPVVQVRHVLDGDSLVLTDGRQVRLIGVNAPEMNSHSRHPGSATAPGVALPPASMQSSRDTSPSLDVAEQPLARAARTLLANLIEGRQVKLVFEEERADRYGRVLAHVLLPDANGVEQSAEEILLRQGLAWMIAIPPNTSWVTRLAAAEDEARAARRGVWAEAAYAPVAAEQLSTHDTGFHFVSGSLRAVRETSHGLYLELAPTVTLFIPRADWKRHFRDTSKQLVLGRRVIARGWLSANGHGLRLRVHHPAMLTWQN